MGMLLSQRRIWCSFMKVADKNLASQSSTRDAYGRHPAEGGGGLEAADEVVVCRAHSTAEDDQPQCTCLSRLHSRRWISIAQRQVPSARGICANQ